MKNTAKTNKKVDSKEKIVKETKSPLRSSVKPKDTKAIGSLKEMKDKIFQKTGLLEKAPEIVHENPKPAETIIENKEKQPVVEMKDPEVEDRKNRVEAILFASGKYLSEDVIAELCGLDKRSARKSLEALQKDYNSKDNSLMVFEDNKNWKINVREKYLSLVRKIVADTEFSKSIMETLAVVAWKTPMSQSEVIKIRGNKAYDHIASLEDSGFVTKSKKGRSYIIKTTDKFYTYFDIDQKNLKGVMEEIKMPEKQATLDEPVPIQAMSKEDMLKNIENISVKRITETDEEKEKNKTFLEQIEGKIKEASERTSKYDEELPKPMHMQENTEGQDVTVLPDDTMKELPAPENVSDGTAGQIPESGNVHEEQAQQTPKKLTKKQLEKKFRDDLLRVREKMQK